MPIRELRENLIAHCPTETQVHLPEFALTQEAMAAWRCRQAWLETEQSLSGVTVEQLSCPGFVTRVRVPSVVNEQGIWLEFMGRPCFRDAYASVRSLPPGRRACIRGIPGSGKSFLLATVAAALLSQSRMAGAFASAPAPVYLGGCCFGETPLEVLKLSLGVTFGSDEAAVEQVMGIQSCHDFRLWLKNRSEHLYFMLDDWDLIQERAWNQQEAVELLDAVVAGGMVLVYCTGAGACCSQADDYLPLMEGLDAQEVSCFLQHKHGACTGLEDPRYLLHCTGYVPRLLSTHCQGDLDRSLIGDYFMGQIDDFLESTSQSQSLWRLMLDALAGAKLSSDLPPQKNGGGFLYRNKEGKGACMCEAMRRHACLRAMEYPTLDAGEVLRVWLDAVLAEEEEAAAQVEEEEAPWSCTMVVAAVLQLREVVRLDVVGEVMVPRVMQALREWWTPSWTDTVYLNSRPMAWPVITVSMYGKAFVLQAGIREDLSPQRNYERKHEFLSRVSAACGGGMSSCQTYFVWIGCFGKRIKGQVVIRYDNHTDVFMNYGELDPLLSPIDNKFQEPPRNRLLCHYMPHDQRCTSYALRNNILCRKHQCLDAVQE